MSYTDDTVNGGANTMTEPTSSERCDQQSKDNADQALGMLNDLRKPLKLTATLKRRALKNKVGKLAIVSLSRRSVP
jgi:hypothetical protein